MNKFKVGDEVVLIKHNDEDSRDNLEIGQEGVVADIREPEEPGFFDVCVEWEGKVKLTKNWWVFSEDLDFVQINLENE